MPVTRFEDLDLSRQYTYADYLTWQFQECVELLRGWVARMSPAPNMRHQDIATRLTGHLYQELSLSACKLFAAPFDVRLPRTDSAESVVQLDLCVICDQHKLTEQGCTGAPDWVNEILSPGNTNREMRDKYALYEESGVREYWVVDPMNEHVLRYVNRGGTFIGLAPRTREDERIKCECFPDLEISGGEVFGESAT